MFDYDNLAFAYGKPSSSGCMKSSPEDFKVEELLGFELSGEGEHLFLLIEKRGINTEELVKELSSLTQYPAKDISYAGLKDRQALVRQWISIQCPGKEIANANSLAGDSWRVVESNRHLKKLKTGALLGNSFQLTLRDIEGIEEVESRLHQVSLTGVPNYFGTQRFGFNGQNLIKAQQVLLDGIKVKNRFLRGIYYSAARSFLFNLVLSARISALSWNKALRGDVMQLAGKNSIFPLETLDELIAQRVSSFDVSPSIPLWGMGKELVTDEALSIQQEALKGYETWCSALEQHKLERSYRAQVLQVKDMNWEWQANTLSLNFNLTSGSYATSVVRELLHVS